MSTPNDDGQQQASSSRLSLPVAHHVPSSALVYNRFGPTSSAAATPTKAPTGSRRPPIPHPSGLETLQEVSHINALHLAQGRAPTGLGHDRDRLDDVIDEALASLPPCQRCLALARTEGYELIAMDLTNQRWKERWERLCLDGSAMEASDSLHADGEGLVRSSSRPGGFPSGPINQQAQTFKEAEEWRRAPSFHRAEVNISKVEESEGVVAFLSSWIELDALDEGVRLDSEIALQQEVSYARHLGVSQVILPPPSSDPERRRYLPDYARAVANCITSASDSSSPLAGNWITLSLRLPVSSPFELSRKMVKARSSTGSAHEVLNGSSITSKAAATSIRAEDDWAWETWNTIQQACSYSPRVQLTIDFGYPLPSSSALSRWISEPVSAIFLPTSAFLANAKGFPVLSKAAQGLFRALSKRRPCVILSEVDQPPPQHTRGGKHAYLQYIRHLEKTTPADTAIDVFAKGYTDWLQAPLQPLMDNLESSTYEVFERDPIKYALYEDAVYQALVERISDLGVHTTTSIWVCGAGRGPLVSRCLAAARRAGARIHVTAVEKNANALVVLQEKQALEWGSDTVQIVFGDMRSLSVPRERADIVVSELLGSFGDNELSPECLDGAMRFLKPTGISIPAEYSSFMTPVSSAKLHAEVLGLGSNAGLTETKRLKSVETPYVVQFQAVSYLAAKGGRGQWEATQPCWAFQHGPTDIHAPVCDPNGLPLTNAHNVRTSSHTFHIPQAGLCHGFAGYFESSLYGNVVMSIHPDPARFSKDMLSWFPIFFPFKDPLYVPASAELDIHLWRMTSSKRVWYEWYAEVHLPLPTSLAGNGTLASHTSTTTTEAYPSLDAMSSDNGHVNFQNAPATPSVLSVNHDNHRLSTSSTVSSAGVTRIKTGMTALMNPGGRSSWIGL